MRAAYRFNSLLPKYWQYVYLAMIGSVECTGNGMYVLRWAKRMYVRSGVRACQRPADKEKGRKISLPA